MLLPLSNIYFVPKKIVKSLKPAADKKSELSREVLLILFGGKSEALSIAKVKQLIKDLVNDPPSFNDLRSVIFSLANLCHIYGYTTLASFLIAAVHDRVPLDKAAVLRDNFNYAKQLFTGTPYNHGRIESDGRLVLRGPRTPDAVPGLNCIRMNNIFSNLVVGAASYTPDVGNTDEDIFKKPELVREGVYGFPVIVKYPGGDFPKIDGLLKQYGNYFAVQMYSAKSGRPIHTIFVYRSDAGYRALDTLAPGPGFGESGSLDDLYKRYGDKMSYTFNLVDSRGVRPVRRSKSADFLKNLEASIAKAKKENAILMQR